MGTALRIAEATPQRGRPTVDSEHDIQAIRWLSDQTTHGVAISRAVEMPRGSHAGPATLVEPVASRGGRSFLALHAELGQALLGLDADRGELLLSEAFALFSVEDVCLHVLQPLLVEVGDRWHAGELSVAEEHYVSSFVRGKLFSLRPAYQTPDSRGPLVFTACAPDEWHEVGILIVSIFLARRGYAVRYLGPNLPLEGLAAIVARHHPAVVALSAQSRKSARKLRGAARGLEEGAPPHPRLVFGGQAFNADARLRAIVDGTLGPDAAATVDAIAQLVDQVVGRQPRRSRSGGGRQG